MLRAWVQQLWFLLAPLLGIRQLVDQKQLFVVHFKENLILHSFIFATLNLISKIHLLLK